MHYFYALLIAVVLAGLPLESVANKTLTLPVTAAAGVKCPAGFVKKEQLNLCVSKRLKRKAFHPLMASEQCKQGYVRLLGLPFCIVDRSSVTLSMRNGLMILNKSRKRRCPIAYAQQLGAKPCIDQRLAVEQEGERLVVKPIARVVCNARQVDAGMDCPAACRPGYLQPLGMVNCVAFELATQGHKGLTNPAPNCLRSKFWHLKNKPGLCLPRVVVRPFKDESCEDKDDFCGAGELPQVVLFANGSPGSVNSSDESAAENSSPALGNWAVKPVIFCSPPVIFRQ